jgi:ParB/RepB/Spo0J family partition protein
MADQKTTIESIPPDKIGINRNVRSSYDENKIIELAESIKKKGLLQPITVTPSSKYGDRPREKSNFGGYDILFGHRRYMAYKLLAEKNNSSSVIVPRPAGRY